MGEWELPTFIWQGCNKANLTSRVHTSSFWWSYQLLLINEKLLMWKCGAEKKGTHGVHHLSNLSTFLKVQLTELHQIHVTGFHCSAETMSKWISVNLACSLDELKDKYLQHCNECALCYRKKWSANVNIGNIEQIKSRNYEFKIHSRQRLLKAFQNNIMNVTGFQTFFHSKEVKPNTL